METLIPFMLLILDWSGDTPELNRHPVVYPDEQACEQAGSEMMPDQSMNDGPRFWCLPLPSQEEFEAMIQQIEADHVARRDAREAERAKPAARPIP